MAKALEDKFELEVLDISANNIGNEGVLCFEVLNTPSLFAPLSSFLTSTTSIPFSLLLRFKQVLQR